MTWPWSRRTEKRAGSVTDSVIAELQRRAAGGSSGDPSLCAAVQTAAGIWARSFAAAAVSPASGTAAAVSPAVLHMIGRDLVLTGQSVLQFGVMPGGPMLRRPAEYDLTGSPDPETWRYSLRYIGPSRDSTAPGTVADVVHIRLNEDARAPHCGVSPILAAADTAGALAGLERALRLEASASSGYVIPSAASEGMDDTTFAALKSDLAKLAGGTRIVPSLGPRAGDPQGRSGDADWKAPTHRLESAAIRGGVAHVRRARRHGRGGHPLANGERARGRNGPSRSSQTVCSRNFATRPAHRRRRVVARAGARGEP